MNESDLIQAQDQQRTARSFVSFLSTALGVDQALPGADGTAYNTPGQYQVVNASAGLVGVEGKPVSSGQGITLTPMNLAIGAVVVALVLVATGHLKV